MRKLSYAAVIAATCILSFAVNAAERQPVSTAGMVSTMDVIKPLPQPCPLGKTEKVILDKSGRPVGRVCV